MPRSRLIVPGKLLALALLMIALWNPHWLSGASPAPLVLLDESASMTLAGGEAPLTRLARWLEHEPGLTGIRLIRFGAEPLPVTDRPRSHGPLAEQPGAAPVRTATDIERALRHALDVARPGEPILLMTDGIETAGDAEPLLRRARTAGRAIHLLDAATPAARGFAWIESIELPAVVMPGQHFDAAITVASPVAQPVDVIVYRDREQAASVSLDLAAGRTVRQLSVRADTPGTLPLRFVLRDRAGGFEDVWHDVVNVHGKARIAYVTEHPAAPLRTSLEQGGWPVDRVAPGRLSGSLQHASVVVLDDVPVRAASDDDWSALVDAVRQRGVGLVVLGGPNAFGAGGYRGSRLESVLPVTAEAGVPQQPAAVLFLLDRSGSMGRRSATGTRIEHARRAVLDTIAHLDAADSVGVVAFHADAEVLLPLDRHREPAAAARQALATVHPSGGTRLGEGLALAVRELGASPVRQRLLVLVTDGFTGAEALGPIVTQIKALDIDVIAIAVGDSPDLEALQALTAVNRGLLLTPGEATRLPRLMPAAVGARRLTVEGGTEAVLTGAPTAHLPLHLEWPPVDGLAVTRARPSALVHLHTSRGDPLLASQRAGLGTVLALPAGLGGFASRWQTWQGWSTFAGGLVEWAAGARRSERARVQIERRRDGVHLLVDVVDDTRDWWRADEATLSATASATLSATLALPGGRTRALELTAAAPGRFTAPLPVAAGGRHRLAIDVAGERLHHDFVPHPASERSLRESRLPHWTRQGLLQPWPPAHRDPQPRPLRIPLIVAALLVYAFTMIVDLDFRIFRNYA